MRRRAVMHGIGSGVAVLSSAPASGVSPVYGPELAFPRRTHPHTTRHDMADRIDSTDGRVERAKDSALGKHDSNPSHLDEAGEAAGGIGGVLAGAAIGSVAGPVGTLIGGIAGAMGGWWAGRAVTEAASKLSKDDDEYYRKSYESSPNRLADRSYDDVRPAYHLGHVAAQNPDYANKTGAPCRPTCSAAGRRTRRRSTATGTA